MKTSTFKRFSDFIYNELGIKMPESKMTLLQSRFQKRLRLLGLKSYDAYCDYVFSPEGMQDELDIMIDRVTTNKTDFFREPKHFTILTDEVLPKLIRKTQAGYGNKLMVWSSASSTGEEPYTLAMVLDDFAKKNKGFKFSILATDISNEVLQHAVNGVYEMEKVYPVPTDFKKRYLLRSKKPERKVVRVVPELRSLVHFQRLNLMDNQFDIRDKMDIIFCRNVIIYFDKPTQNKVINSLCRHLKPGGYMFMGHSETLSGLNVPLKLCGSTVYRKISDG
ncbi:MAG: protein-glutamate O-methyltransferase [Desulfobacterales bacterium]|nr:protein-glutamate O-methyltransferase [Desulfobacterales bacterium]